MRKEKKKKKKKRGKTPKGEGRLNFTLEGKPLIGGKKKRGI